MTLTVVWNKSVAPSVLKTSIAGLSDIALIPVIICVVSHRKVKSGT